MVVSREVVGLVRSGANNANDAANARNTLGIGLTVSTRAAPAMLIGGVVAIQAQPILELI